MFGAALSSAGLDASTAARAMGVSRQLVSWKANPMRPEPVTLGDVIDLIDGAPDAGEAVVRALQARVDKRRGVHAPSRGMLPRICLFVMSIVGEMSAECSMGSPDGGALRRLCAQLHAQVAQLEACVGAAA